MKYPKTPHLPWSPGTQKDDKRISSLSTLQSEKVAISEKLDGENTFMDSNSIHARSENSKDHPSRHLIKSIHGSIVHLFPDWLGIYGENVFAKHSIHYDKLADHFYVFGAVDKRRNVFLSVDDTIVWARTLGLSTVPCLYRGPFIEFPVPNKSHFGKECEGYVVRTENEFLIKDFNLHVAKWVRPGHVQTTEHWSRVWTKNNGF